MLIGENKSPKYNMIRLSGGGALCEMDAIWLSHIEKRTGYYTRDLAPGGLIVSSGGSIPGIAASLSHPDNPSRPLYSMEESARVYGEKSPIFIPQSPDHHKNQVIRHVVKEIANGKPDENKSALTRYFERSAQKIALNRFGKEHIDDDYREKIIKILDEAANYTEIPIHYETDHIAEILKKLFGEQTTMGEVSNNLIVTSHIISPKRGPFNFQNADPRYIQEDSDFAKNIKTQNVPLWKIVMATIAFPTIFPEFHIRETGTTHIDQAHVDSGASQVLTLHRSLKGDFESRFIQFGNLGEHKALSPSQYRDMDCVDMLVQREYMKAAAIQVQEDGREIIRGAIGEDNTHFIEIKDSNKYGFSDDIMDTSPQQLEKMRNAAHEHLKENMDMFNRLADTLAEDKVAIDAIGMSTETFQNKSKPHNDNGILDKVIHLFDFARTGTEEKVKPPVNDLEDENKPQKSVGRHPQ